MDRLLERIHTEEAQTGPDGGVDGLTTDLAAGQSLDGIDGVRPNPVTLPPEPVLEAGLPEGKALEQVALVHGQGLLRPGRAASTGKSLEAQDVDLHAPAVQGHGPAVDLERGPRQRLPEGDERLA